MYVHVCLVKATCTCTCMCVQLKNSVKNVRMHPNYCCKSCAIFRYCYILTFFGTEVCKMHEEIIPSGLDFWGKTLGLKFTDLVACKSTMYFNQ